jgi:hypothetical protein
VLLRGAIVLRLLINPKLSFLYLARRVKRSDYTECHTLAMTEAC